MGDGNSIIRPLHLPSLRPGEPCPTTKGSRVDLAGFGGIALGTRGPVHPIIAAIGARRGNAIADGGGRGMYGVKTLWYAEASYSGPVLIRGQRPDGAGTITFGEGPQWGFLADTGTPSGVKANTVRSWPGGTYVKSPGCYGFQVDGTSFSYRITLAIRVPQPS
jgi:hypothetical protein